MVRVVRGIGLDVGSQPQKRIYRSRAVFLNAVSYTHLGLVQIGSSPVGKERNDYLVFQVVCFEECTDYHCGLMPPARRTDEHCIIFRKCLFIETIRIDHGRVCNLSLIHIQMCIRDRLNGQAASSASWPEDRWEPWQVLYSVHCSTPIDVYKRQTRSYARGFIRPAEISENHASQTGLFL